MTCYRNGIKCMLLLLFMGLAALNTYSYWRDSHSFNYRTTSMHPEVTVEQSSITPFHCPFESWNQKHSDTVPNENLHLEWIQNNISRRDNILESQIRLLSSFVYLDHISIITNSQRSYGQKVYCRYYNCLREEISNSSYQSIFFPMNVIRCPRRIGVKYMSISFDSEEIPQEPIPLVYRVFEVFNMNEYSRKIIDEYLRTGEIELTVIQSEYKTIDWQFHMLQINECHQRSKHHSKWVINVDIDEKLVILDDKINSVGSLLSGYNNTVAEVGFAIRRIQKTEKLPEKYESDEQIISEMEFLKYNVSSPVTWGAYKTIYRPEKVQVSEDNSNRINSQDSYYLHETGYSFQVSVLINCFRTLTSSILISNFCSFVCKFQIAAMYYHWAYQRYPGTVAEYVKSEVALFRHGLKIIFEILILHFRTTEKNILGSGWLTDPNYKNFSIVPEEAKFAEKLKENVLKKIKYVYDQRVLYCEEIAEIPYEEYKEFGHDIFNCTFRNETEPLAPSQPSFFSQTPPPPPPAPSVISNSGDVFARSRKEISATPDFEQQSGTAATLSGSSHEWKVSIIPRGQNNKPTGVNSIPPFTIDGKADERFNKFYRTIDSVINKLDLTNSGDQNTREKEPQIRLEGNTKDLSVESSAVVIVPRTTIAPGVTNKVSVIPFRPLHFTAPPKNGPPGVSPPPTPGGQCGVAPEFTPCVNNEIASKSLLECCKRKNLPAGCQQLCRYDITQAEIRAAMDRGQCGIFNVAPFLECASQGKDNSECCRHRGIVQKTGPQCEQFCRPTQGLSALGVQHSVKFINCSIRKLYVEMQLVTCSIAIILVFAFKFPAFYLNP
ncbi:hypothetical protein CRE_21474 [Caenorhabditis remanei]|uniref:Domain of unknown function DB domain-containing protein n=1 Tax=Caenorhabditis remanei TaxID=31234 RepID=E3N3Q9_CAERE|nr:hypothetical protein CRE_21474 [Caenorhabditis remanei]